MVVARARWRNPDGTCRVIKMRASIAVGIEMKRTLGFLGWGACKKPRYGYYTRHAAHHGHAPSPFPSSLQRGNDGVLSSLFILSTEGAALLRHLRGTKSRAHLLSEKRAEGTAKT